MLEGMLLPSNMAAKITSCLYLVQRFIVTLRCALNVITSSFGKVATIVSSGKVATIKASIRIHDN